MSTSFVTGHQAVVDQMQAALGGAAFDDAVATGSGWPWEAAVAEVSDYLRTLGQRDAAAPKIAGPGQSPNQALTDRQLQVVRLLAAGLTNKEVAVRLGLTPKTVMHHTVAIYQRLGVRSRSEAVAWAIRGGVAPAAS
jgi:DNA-binding NarL/FixJ family response regulator